MPNVADSLLGLFHPKQERPPPAISAPKPATTASPPRRRNSARKSAPHGSHDGPSSAPWAIKDEDKKRGAGLLFFAYGQLSAIQKYLHEATDAAASFRALNPKLQIAIVSNNGTVDARVFSHHITPRPDLLFAGRPFANGADPMPRQWLTRLYYMAHSPYALTWALDSGVLACAGDGSKGAVQGFLDEAERTQFWGFDVAQANQAHGAAMYPHNWNILYRWTPRTSAMMRDWFLLQLRRGVATDDQKTLHAAEARQLAAGGLAVGQMPAEFATAFYSPLAGAKKFYPRITRSVRGRVHVVHHTKPATCAAANVHAGRIRQLLQRDKDRPIETLTNASACRKAVHGSDAPAKRCPYTSGASEHRAEGRGPKAVKLVPLKEGSLS